MNWLLRKAGLQPAPPGGPRDARKLQLFDGLSTLTRKGLRYRGL